VSRSGHLGALYGFDIPVCHAMGEAMLAGAKAVNPEATLTVTAVGDWGDVSAAKEAGLAQVDTAGVDYWIGCGEGPTLGSIEAAKERGGYATGYVGDMAELGPETVLASIVWDMTPIFDRLIEQTAAGTFQGEFIRYGVKEGALDIAVNSNLSAKVPDAAVAAIVQARAAIRAGTLEVPFVPQ
jgi:simple sugar transport system substrate-binding protein/basic membrane protein A